MRLLLICFLLPLHLLAQDSAIHRYVDSLMAPLNKSDIPASMLIIAKDGRPVVKRAFGMANLEMGTPATTGQLFTLASLNKQMIAVCILQLVQQGKMTLTGDLRKYLPTFNTHGKIITIEQLLNHTSGIFSGNSPVRGKSFYDYTATAGVLSDEEFLDYTMQVPLSFEPGTDWSWNTWAFHIAFFIVEKVSGMPFNEYARKYLFEPAGMTNSFSKVDGNRMGFYGIKDLNQSFYFRDFDGKWVWRDNRRLLPYLFYQRYSIVTSLDDLVKWDMALRNGTLLSGEWLAKAWTSGRLRDGRPINYGLGWVVSEHDGYKIISHIGIGTNPICAVHVPQEGIYIAYTQFFGTYPEVESKVKKILSRLLPLSYPFTTIIETPLTDYAGTYAVHRNGLDLAAQVSDVPVYIHVTASNDTLYVQQTASEKIALRPSGRDRFMPVGSENTWYAFKRDNSGKVHAITTRGTLWTYGPEVLNKRTTLSMPKPVKAVTVSTSLLKKYEGIYCLPAVDNYILIETDGSKLYNVVQGRKQELIAVANNKFVRKGAEDVTYEFKVGTKAKKMFVSGLRKAEYKKIK